MNNSLDAVDDELHAREWSGLVFTAIGVRTLEPKSGLRGVVAEWIDANGRAGSKTFDFAVVTCEPTACSVD